MADYILTCQYCGYSARLSTWEAHNIDKCPKCKDEHLDKKKIDTTDYFGYTYKEKKK